jgi:hypothetical protein
MGKMVRAGAGAGIFDKLKPDFPQNANYSLIYLCVEEVVQYEQD